MTADAFIAPRKRLAAGPRAAPPAPRRRRSGGGAPGLTELLMTADAFIAPWKRLAGIVPDPVNVPLAPFGQAAGPVPSPVQRYSVVVMEEPPTSIDSSRSPFERQGGGGAGGVGRGA